MSLLYLFNSLNSPSSIFIHLQEDQVHILHRKFGRTAFLFKKMNPKRYRPFWGTMLSSKKIVSTSNSWVFFSSFIFRVVGEELSIFTISAGTGAGASNFVGCTVSIISRFPASIFIFTTCIIICRSIKFTYCTENVEEPHSFSKR